MSRPTYIFAGGGTGGHLYPALAVAERLTALRPDAVAVFACSDRDIDRRILEPTPYAMTPQPIRPLPRGLRGWGTFLRGWVRSGRLARRMVADLQPAAVLGLGGFAAAPVVQAASRRGVRCGLLSIDAIPGVANRSLAGHVEAIFAQFESTAAAYGRRADKVRVIGCPVRAGLIGGDRAEALRQFGLRDDRRTLLVMAGSLGAANINEALARLRPDLEALADRWQVLHLAGPGKMDAAAGAFAGSTLTYAARAFCDRMDLAYAAADLVLCRAGASTVGELAAVGRPGVLMPYPYHRDQHQRANIVDAAAAGAAVEVLDAKDPAANAEALRRELLPILSDADRLERMAAAAAGRARTDAADQIARWLAG